MRDSAFKVNQDVWENSSVYDKRISKLGSDNKSLIKSRLGFIYFVVLISSLIVLFAR